MKRHQYSLSALEDKILPPFSPCLAEPSPAISYLISPSDDEEKTTTTTTTTRKDERSNESTTHETTQVNLEDAEIMLGDNKLGMRPGTAVFSRRVTSQERLFWRSPFAARRDATELVLHNRLVSPMDVEETSLLRSLSMNDNTMDGAGVGGQGTEAGLRLRRGSSMTTTRPQLSRPRHRVLSFAFKNFAKWSSIGAGASGNVFKALHLPSGLWMALKELKIHPPTHEAIARIQAELDILFHATRIIDSVVKYYGAFCLDNAVYICMEWMDCGSVASLWKGTHNMSFAGDADPSGDVGSHVGPGIQDTMSLYGHGRGRGPKGPSPSDNALKGSTNGASTSANLFSTCGASSSANTPSITADPSSAFAASSAAHPFGAGIGTSKGADVDTRTRIGMGLDEGQGMAMSPMALPKPLSSDGMAVPEAVIKYIVFFVLMALKQLAELLGVVHLDIKPSNILLNSRGQVKLCDFGISFRLIDDGSRAELQGCLSYLAPERLEPGGGLLVAARTDDTPETRLARTSKADVWSVGITCYELALGSSPYAAAGLQDSVFAQRYLVCNTVPALPPTPPFSSAFRSFVARCLQRDVDARASVSDLLVSLTHLILHAGACVRLYCIHIYIYMYMYVYICMSIYRGPHFYNFLIL